MKRVCEGVYQLEAGGFVNSYLIEDGSDLTLVDAGPARTAAALMEEIKDNGFNLRDVGRIVLTHAHGDHVGGIKPILERHRMRVFAHPNDVPVLLGQARRPSMRGLGGFWRDQLFPWEPLDAVLPIDGSSMRALPHWQVLHAPGHTAGSVCLFHPARQVLLCGDALSNRGGRLHVPSSGLSDDEEQARASLELLSGVDCDVLCPGHGPVVRGGAFRFVEKLKEGSGT